ncbi:hypothetical protein C0993_004380 [Termitomyces sp. T159_Od127]|nr:hypothetical protein C0993_004380 [Termitomyces sp. T159_Od127]
MRSVVPDPQEARQGHMMLVLHAFIKVIGSQAKPSCLLPAANSPHLLLLSALSTMSATSTPNDSPAPSSIQPMHNPSQAAHIVVPQAPLGNVANQAPSLGTKALLAKRMAKTQSVNFFHRDVDSILGLTIVPHVSNPNFVSPTDNLVTPVTKKLNAAKKKQFSKGAKPVQLFASQPTQDDDSGDEQIDRDVPSTTAERKGMIPEADDENPF